MNTSQIVLIIALVLILAFAAYNFYKYFALQSKKKASLSWPEASATVTRSETAYSTSSKGNKSYRAEIEYSYEVLGTPYSGKKQLRSFWGLEKTAIENTEKYPKGSVFLLRYNPEKPADHISDIDSRGVSPLSTAILFLVIWLVLVYVTFFM